ncbi:unnamed protein product [Penicillium camemberti]|uniref:Str. FM013 n=1 Tax=Penicillium camemberti (strain FM 013) TaxID=1429867 RepID=A0A0G4P3N5_PENC3|nr:unnamed protein product [Penicillium camemberti]
MVGVFGSCPYATIASGNGDKTMNRVSDERDGQEARPVPESEHLILPRQPWKDLMLLQQYTCAHVLFNSEPFRQPCA